MIKYICNKCGEELDGQRFNLKVDGSFEYPEIGSTCMDHDITLCTKCLGDIKPALVDFLSNFNGLD